MSDNNKPQKIAQITVYEDGNYNYEGEFDGRVWSVAHMLYIRGIKSQILADIEKQNNN